jgi:hypothetical protein
MQILQRFAWAVLLMLSVVTARGEVPREEVRAMFERDGTVEYLSAYSERTEEYFAKSITDMVAADEVAPIAKIAGEAWDGEQLLELMVAAYAEALMPSDLAAMNAFRATPLFTRILAAERAASTTEASLEIDARRDELASALRSDSERLEAFKRIDRALRSTELEATSALSFVEGLILGGNEYPETYLPPAETLASMRSGILEDNRKIMMASFAFTYRDLTLSDLQGYVEYLESDAAAISSAIYFSIINDYSRAAGKILGKGTIEVLLQKRS